MKTRNILFPVLDITAGIVEMERYSLTKQIDLTGQIFGHLEVIEYAGSDNGALWRCRCDCGNEIIVKGTRLRCGNKKIMRM